MYWDAEIETLERSGLEALQLKRLKKLAARVAKQVPFYQQKFAESGVKPSQIRSLADVRRLPFTTNSDLRAQYPKGFLIPGKDDLIRLHTSSGTTGKPKALFFSRKDVDQAAELIARCLVMTGVTKQDVLQNMMTYGLFTGALVMHYGAEKLGMMVIPAGPGNSEKQLLLMQDFRSTVIHTTPSYALYFSDFLEKKGVDPRRDLALRKAYIGSEPYSEATTKKNRGSSGRGSVQFLRAIRDERTWSGIRLRGPQRHAHLGGQLPGGNHQSRDRRAAARRRNGRNGADESMPGGNANSALSDPGHHVDRPRSLQLRTDTSAVEPDHRTLG